MTSILNSRLVGRTFRHTQDSEKITVQESMPGLAAGYVTVKDEGGRMYNENLPSVLRLIDDQEASFRTASSLMARAERLRAIATEFAAMAVSHDMPPEAEALMAEMDAMLGKAADGCAKAVNKAKRQVAANQHQPSTPTP